MDSLDFSHAGIDILLYRGYIGVIEGLCKGLIGMI